MDLPRELSDLGIINKLRAGTVIKTKVSFDDGEQKIKLLIILTNKNDYLVLSVTTTSKTNKQLNNYAIDDIYVPQGTETVFSLPTIVQLNRLIPLQTEIIKENYHIHELSIIGNISNCLMQKIINTIQTSNFLLKADVKRILDENEY